MSQYKSLECKNADLKIRVLNLGGIITNLFFRDSAGKTADLVLGHDSPADYLKSGCYLGAIAGRVANRIGGAAFSLGGKKYRLAKNDGEKNSLHGGLRGFDKVLWDICECSGDGWKGLRLNYLSRDGEEGYPGNLEMSVYYKLTDDNALVIEYLANTDKPTPCAPTQHSYFNLSGGKEADVLSHSLKVNADHYTPSDKSLIPTGEILKLKGTALDFRSSRALGGVLLRKDPLLSYVGGGLDHNFVLKGAPGGLAYAATLSHEKSGRKMDVFTTCPGMQIYSGNFLKNIRGKGGKIYNKYAGICLETQFWPDAPNKPHFPSATLKPSEQFYSATVYKFS